MLLAQGMCRLLLVVLLVLLLRLVLRVLLVVVGRVLLLCARSASSDVHDAWAGVRHGTRGKRREGTGRRARRAART